MTTNLAGVKYLEEEIARLHNRIKKIRENPDPKRPKSNVLLYEAELDLRLEQLEGVKLGKPFGYLINGPLTRALGFIPWDGIWAADRTRGEDAKRYFEIIRARGMAENTCDRTVVIVAMVLSGDFPKPDFMFTTNYECVPIHLSNCTIAHSLDIPIFMVDRNFEDYAITENEDNLHYVEKQLENCIEYVQEKIPGCKYDKDKLIELQYYDRLFLEQYQILYNLRKSGPCPLSGRDAFREIRLADLYPNPKKAVEYMRMFVEEIAEKVEKGQGAVEGEERLRLLWSVSGPFFADPFQWLEKRGVSVPAAEMSLFNMWFSKRQAIYGDPWKGRQLSPLEEEARMFDWLWGRLGQPWVETNLNTCKDLDLDGIVYFLQWGCSTTNNLGKVVSDTAKQKLGIPTLLIEGRMLDQSVFDEKDFFEKLEDFIETCLDAKKNRNK